MKPIKFLFVLLSFLCFVPAFAQKERPEGLKVGDLAPNFEGKTIYNKHFSLAKAMEKNEIVVINFWFVACGPCIAEIKQLRGLQEKYAKDKKVRFIGLSIDEPKTQKIIRDFVEIKRFPYEHITHAKPIADKWEISGYPTNIVVSKGKIVYISSGYHADIMEQLDRAIQEAKSQDK